VCSSKVPGDKSPSFPHKPTKKKTAPKVERASIPPSSSDEEVEIEGMVSSAKTEQKRIKLERKVESGQKGEFEQLLDQTQDCFGVRPDNENDLPSIASFCFDTASRRLLAKNYVSNEEIVKIYHLFFDTSLRPICEEQLRHPLNPRAPHPVHVFRSLFDCIEALEAYPSFQDALQAREVCLERDAWNNPKTAMGRFIQLDILTRERVRPIILAQEPNFENMLNNFPLYSTKDFFDSDTIHSAYVLRGKNFQPKWIFKPTSKVTLEYGLLGFNADPPILSDREHWAHLVNFHSQFPIPATYLVEIKGFVGSVQLFIENAQAKSKLADSQQISVEDLQKLLVFDLLFSNCDRHEDNFLFRQEEGKFHVYGIDHDSCFCFDNRPLKIMLLKFVQAFDCPFVESIKNLVSEKNIEIYTHILNEQEAGSKAIKWIIFVGEYLRTACNKNEFANVAAKKLMAEFDDKHVK
jgi:phosphoinositide 3-/4-kinase-like protein